MVSAVTVSEDEKRKALPQVSTNRERKFPKWGSCILSVQSTLNTMEQLGDATLVLAELRASIQALPALWGAFLLSSRNSKGRETDPRA